MSDWRLIVGLGNPGESYRLTRHNMGATLIDSLATAYRVPMAAQSKYQASLGKLDEKILLIPQVFMNLSGESVGAAARFYRIAPEQLLVCHDELDLAPGAVRLKQGGGDAGHNGLRDIRRALGSGDFWRLRLGIGHPRQLGLPHSVADFVLARPSDEHKLATDRAIAAVVGLWPTICAGDVTALQRLLHVLG